jgi:hypothetical protein
MSVYKFSGNANKYFAYTVLKDGSNLPNKIEEKPIEWTFLEQIDTSDFSNDRLKKIKERGYYVGSPTIQFEKERTEKIKNQLISFFTAPTI